jgi:hypothetical protein
MKKKMHNPSFGHNSLFLKRRKKRKEKHNILHQALNHWVHTERWSAYSSINTRTLVVLMPGWVASHCLVMAMLILPLGVGSLVG